VRAFAGDLSDTAALAIDAGMESHLNIYAIPSATEIRRGSHPSRPRLPGGKSAVRPPESEKTDEIIKAPRPGLVSKVNVKETGCLPATGSWLWKS